MQTRTVGRKRGLRTGKTRLQRTRRSAHPSRRWTRTRCGDAVDANADITDITARIVEGALMVLHMARLGDAVLVGWR